MSAKQLSDGNSEGTLLGQSSTDKVGFYNTGPVVQPSGPSQAVLTRGQQAGVIATYGTTQSPSSVLTITTTEKSMTVQSGTGGTMLIGATDLIYVNKPTAQAGLGMGNVRYASSNTIGVNFGNWTASTLTPTATQVYTVVAVRGVPTLSATLSPAAVAANATVEQQFAVTGLASGALVQVSKPTAQAGLDIVGCRVVSDNLLGITFANVTAATLTPTAAEAYTVFGVFGLDALNNSLFYGMNMGTVGAIGAGLVITGGSTALLGILATDIVTGIAKPTAQAAATNATWPVGAILTADTVTAYFLSAGSGITPTAAEVYGIHTVRVNPAAPMVKYAQSLAPVSVAANTTAEQTFTVTGLVAGSAVWVNKPSAQSGLGIAGVRVSAVNTLAINYTNSTAAAIVPTTETYQIGNFQVVSPGAGNVVYQTVSPALNAMGNFIVKTRSGLVDLGLMAGA